jgi:hypothetical protein
MACGGVAQSGERLLCKQEVIGSIPFTSTTPRGAGRRGIEGTAAKDRNTRLSRSWSKGRGSERSRGRRCLTGPVEVQVFDVDGRDGRWPRVRRG